jgi:hypothetical protein
MISTKTALHQLHLPPLHLRPNAPQLNLYQAGVRNMIVSVQQKKYRVAGIRCRQESIELAAQPWLAHMDATTKVPMQIVSVPYTQKEAIAEAYAHTVQVLADTPNDFCTVPFNLPAQYLLLHACSPEQYYTVWSHGWLVLLSKTKRRSRYWIQTDPRVTPDIPYPARSRLVYQVAPNTRVQVWCCQTAGPDALPYVDWVVAMKCFLEGAEGNFMQIAYLYDTLGVMWSKFKSIP